MAGNKHSPGCRCCGCVKFADTFTRADSTNLGSDWTEVAGDWSIVSNKLETSAAGLVLTTVDVDEYHHVAATIEATSSGDKVRIIGDGIDQDNYRAVEFESNGISNATRRYIRRSSGTDTQYGPDEDAKQPLNSTPREFRACFEEHRVTSAPLTGKACAFQPATFFTVAGYGPGGGSGFLIPKIGGTKIGFATQVGLTGAVRVSEVGVWKASEGDSSAGTSPYTTCRACEYVCCGCLELAPPPQLKVVIAGMADAGTCAACVNYDGTYYLDFYESSIIHSADTYTELGTSAFLRNLCEWRYTFPANLCTGDIPILRVMLNDVGQLFVFLGHTVPAAFWFPLNRNLTENGSCWSMRYTPAIERRRCLEFPSLAVPHFWDTTSAGGWPCNGMGATVTVQAA